MSAEGYVYLLHFETPLAHAKHYLGSTNVLERRIAQHKKGVGARLTQVLAEKGIGFSLVRTWSLPTLKEARLKEKELKRSNNSPRFCPVCK